MANLIKLNTPSAWTSISFTAGDLNSLASGGGALGSTVISNSSGLDLYVDVSLIVTVGGTTVAASYLSLFLLPLQQDGSTYGDGYASSSSSQPVLSYLGQTCNVKVGVTSGNTVQAMFQQMPMVPGDYKVALGNNLSVALNSTASLTLKYRTYSLNGNG